MCIALLTTSHPKYALIIIDNRDEYILRPTSRPHWWTARTGTDPAEPSPSGSAKVDVLSSRDLQRSEHGTWLGITKGGNFAVLTNYRETDTHDAVHPIHGKRSRGGIVTAWLGADPEESVESFVSRMLKGGDVKGVGGFSLICGKLRKTRDGKLQPLAILSNRHNHIGHVPWICGERGSVYGLSNTTYVIPDDKQPLWPKVQQGSEMLAQAISLATENNASEEELLDALFKILDTDNFSPNHSMDLEDGMPLLKGSIFIPAFGGKEHQKEMHAARDRGRVRLSDEEAAAAELELAEQPDDNPNGFQKGLYGTQRQTIVLVDWDGNVVYKERSLWDANGNAIPRGQGDITFNFKIEGWESEEGAGAERL